MIGQRAYGPSLKTKENPEPKDRVYYVRVSDSSIRMGCEECEFEESIGKTPGVKEALEVEERHRKHHVKTMS